MLGRLDRKRVFAKLSQEERRQYIIDEVTALQMDLILTKEGLDMK
jgi:hypothetical protein